MHKQINRDIQPKHYQPVFVEIVKSNSYYVPNNKYLLKDNSELQCVHASLILLEKKTMRLEQITQTFTHLDKGCPVDVFIAIKMNYAWNDETMIDVLTFKNESYPYLEINNYVPQLLRHDN